MGTNLRGFNQDIALRDAVLHAWSQAISTIWIMSTPIVGFVLILTLFLREYSLDSKVVRGGETKTPGDLERGTTESARGGEHQGSMSLDDDSTAINTIIEPEDPRARKGKTETA